MKLHILRMRGLLKIGPQISSAHGLAYPKGPEAGAGMDATVGTTTVP